MMALLSALWEGNGWPWGAMGSSGNMGVLYGPSRIAAWDRTWSTSRELCHVWRETKQSLADLVTA